MAVLALAGYFIIDNKNSSERNILSMISKNREIVDYYCQVNNLKPRVYISVVYGELRSNYNFFDGFDNIRAEYGFNPSAGYGQMRVSTFMWLEENFADGKIITKSRNRDEVVRKIMNDTINIAYTTFYVNLIRKKLQSIDNILPTIKQLGSFYSLGIDHGRREINKNATTPVGINAEKFYYSNKLIDLYPMN